MYIIGIDIGGSMTKICGFRLGDGALIEPMHIKASDQLSSVYGAFGKFCAVNSIELKNIKKIMMTGVGCTFINTPLYNIPTESVDEFKSTGLGGLYLSGLDKAIAVSMGTGTSIVKSDKDGQLYLGGTGVGGGTLIGLSKLLLNMSNIEHIIEMAKDGDLSKTDLRIGDLMKKDIIPGMPDYLTAANFGKISDIASKGDIALGIINMVFETIGMMSIFASRQFEIKDIVLMGNLTRIPQSKSIFSALNDMFKVNFQIPLHAQYGPVIGAALWGKSTLDE